jgi:hypothetical protein
MGIVFRARHHELEIRWVQPGLRQPEHPGGLADCPLPTTRVVEKGTPSGVSAETRLKEKSMEKAERSLRFMVEKWLGMAPAMSVRVTRGSRARSKPECYVCVEGSLPTGAFAIYLFRQGDGTWDVFPTDSERAVMSVY